MKKKFLLLTMLTLTALLFTGCAMRTVEDMYALPKRSKEYSQLQTAIDTAMYGMTYSSPQTGENQQSVQLADLNGDGIDEHLVFARGASEKPLQILIFEQCEDGTVRTMETIGISGLAFEQVEYVEFDGKPGCELVVGIHVSDQVLRSVAVYGFESGDAELLLLNGYSKFLTTDLDEDSHRELMVFRPGEAESERGMAVLYSWNGGQIERSVERELSEPTSQIRRITQSRLQDGSPAVYVASAVEEDAIVTDIFALKDGRFTNISFSGAANASVRTMQNFYIYADDMDEDGILELPDLVTMKPVYDWLDDEQKFLLRWFSIDIDGWEMEKIYTFHNHVGGWYLKLDRSWANRVTVDQSNGVYTFYVWDESYQNVTHLFTIYVLTGSDRDEEAVMDNRFALYRSEGVAYAAKLRPDALAYDITEDYLIECFRLIRQDWRTGDA